MCQNGYSKKKNTELLASCYLSLPSPFARKKSIPGSDKPMIKKKLRAGDERKVKSLPLQLNPIITRSPAQGGKVCKKKMKTLSQEEKKFVIETANYIWCVIQTSGCIWWSWGVYDQQPTIHRNMPALSFSVNGFKHKGKVYVALNQGLDLFEIFLINSEGKEVKHIEEVFVEDLVSVLDKYIETDNDKSEYYKEKVKEIYGL